MTAFLLRLASLSLPLALLASAASASQITYAPVNPIFQPGNPLAGPQLLAIAEAQKKKEPENTGATGLGERTVAETVKASLLSRITSEIYNNIFQGTGASGSFDLGDGNRIDFTRAGGNVTITFFDPQNGQTVITVPDF